MTNRENVLRALRRDKPERVPFEFVLCPSHIDEFEKRFKTRDYMDFCRFPIRYAEINETTKKTDFTKYYRHIPQNATPLSWNPEWGMYGVNSTMAHFQEMLHPMQDFTDLDQIYDYPFPDFNEDYRWDGYEDKVIKIKNADLASVAFMQMTIFEIAWYLRGMENFMVDMVEDPDFACALLDQITEIRIGMAEKYAKSGIDILMLGDDVSTQLNMMMNPEEWRNMLKPRLASVIQAAKNNKPDILIFYHGDGNLQKIIPDLVEIGVDILNPVQPECMNPDEIKKLYGSSLSFWGTLGTQTTLPYGTPEEVKKTCIRMIETVGKDGGLLLAPTHMIEPDVPWQNIQAFLDAVNEYGKY